MQYIKSEIAIAILNRNEIRFDLFNLQYSKSLNLQ